MRHGSFLRRLKQSRSAPARLLCGLVWSLRNSLRQRKPVLFYHWADIVNRVWDGWFVEGGVRPGEIVVDIGAGIVDEAVIFSRAVRQTGEVIAVEAYPATCDILRETVRINGLSKVSIVQCAASELPGHFSMVTGDSHLAAQLTSAGVGDEVEVLANPIPQLFDELDVESVDFLKTNIEWAELSALRGCVGQFHRIRRVAVSCHDFIAEVRPEEAWMRTYKGVVKLLRANGYHVVAGRQDPRPWVRYCVYASRD